MNRIAARHFLLIGTGLFLSALTATAQTVYSIDVSSAAPEAKPGHFNMGHAGPAGKEIRINTRYLTIGGVAQVPVMGEMQYSRVASDRWEDVILKMKAAGITIISTYAFWIHHEEIEGQFDWSGNKDLRAFLQLCARHDMLVCARIGPWAHGEARNGGTPDWILSKKNLQNRSNDPVYQQYVSRYFQQLGEQLKGLLYKDGGPVMAIQLENEYTKGVKGEPHIQWLKQTARRYGMDVPMYTVTGWGDGSVPPGEVIPLWGGYPDQPWDPTIEKMTGCGDFEFNPFRNDDKIGNGLAQKKDQYMDYSDEPFFTCEMGVGVQTTRHRRSVIGKYDGLAMTTNRVGSGSNLLGYYVFAGGSNPTGTLSAFNEDMDETGNWSETPAISYDFQAAIGENGWLAPSYYQAKRLNYFLNEFGRELAPMEPFFTTNKDGFQYAVRSDGNSAFVFGINYCRFAAKPLRKGVQFKVKLKNEELLFPSRPIDIADSSIFIWPVNMDLDGVTLKYATAQPLCQTRDGQGERVTVFFTSGKAAPEFCLDASAITRVEAANGKAQLVNGRWIVSGLQPGLDCLITITGKNGQRQKLLVLTPDQSLQAWVLKDDHNKKHFFLSEATLYLDGEKLNVIGTNNRQTVYQLGNAAVRNGVQQQGAFSVYRQVLPEKKIVPAWHAKGILDDAQWLRTSVDAIYAQNKLYHKIFLKEFNLGNPSALKSAILYMAAPTYGRVQVNNVWVNQPVDTGRLAAIDITGYVKKGDNTLMIDFPFEQGNYSFAARVMVEYFNTDATGFVTDTSWRLAEQYYYPSPLGTFGNYFSTPQVMPRPAAFRDSYKGFTEYTLDIPCDYLDGLNNLYLSVNYTGIRSELRQHHKLIADRFNDNTTWRVDLNRSGSQLQCRQLWLKIFPLQPQDKILFDLPPTAGSIGQSRIDTLQLIPEYKTVIRLNTETN
ncbi:MAG: beta-galactosidase [Chitinophagaceae bacterium]